MADETLILTLAKVLIAVGWADGELTHDEVNSMKDLLFRLPELSARQWSVLQMYIESPVGDEERARLTAELQEAVRSRENAELVQAVLAELVAADGAATPQESAAVAEITAALAPSGSGVTGKLRGLVQGLTQKRSTALSSAPNRERDFDDFVRNKVYYGLRHSADGNGALQEIPDQTLRKLSLAGGLMAQVARVNPQVTDDEVGALVGALEQQWSLTPEQAALVAGVATAEVSASLDRVRLAREFSEVCSLGEAMQFVDVLFAVATADGQASYAEIEEIRLISASLKLSHREFIDAKLRVPRGLREQ